MLKVALAGVGSCASSLVQLVESAKQGSSLPGVHHANFGGIAVSDVEFVAAFDVDREKVGLDLSEAVFAGLTAAVPHVKLRPSGVTVLDSPLLDGLDGALQAVITATAASHELQPEAVVNALREAEAEVVVCFLPTGSAKAARMFATCAADAGAAFVNGTPETIARDPDLQALFRRRGLPLLGDDTRSMLGATTLHAALIQLLLSKGVRIDGTYQLNVGGNTDFFNLSDPDRSWSKVLSKRNALAGAGIESKHVLAGPNGYVDYLGDTKICHINLTGTSVLGSHVQLDVKLTVEDSPNAAGTIVDAIRAAKLAIDRGLSGAIADPSYLLFKSPPFGALTHNESVEAMEAFLDGRPTSQVVDDELAEL